VQPIVVRAAVAGRYELIAGERRWRAAQLAGLPEVPALIREVSDQVAMAMALIENIQREDLNPLEEAQALKRLIEEFTMTHQQVAETIGRSRATVTNLLRLLELNEEVRQLVQDQRLEMGHARALLPLPPALQQELARQVARRGLSVRETEAWVKRLQNGPATPSANRAPDPDIRNLQEDLSARLGARVLVRHGASGKGRLVIHYNTLDELDGILNRVK
jgi:ParB family chromosome partitioning protein